MEGDNEKVEPDVEILDVDDDSNGNDGSNENSEVLSESEEKELVDWAYKVMDWLCCAVEARAWEEILKNADDILTAFLVLVEEEHRGIVMDTFRRIVSSLREGV